MAYDESVENLHYYDNSLPYLSIMVPDLFMATVSLDSIKVWATFKNGDLVEGPAA